MIASFGYERIAGEKSIGYRIYACDEHGERLVLPVQEQEWYRSGEAAKAAVSFLQRIHVPLVMQEYRRRESVLHGHLAKLLSRALESETRIWRYQIRVADFRLVSLREMLLTIVWEEAEYIVRMKLVVKDDLEVKLEYVKT